MVFRQLTNGDTLVSPAVFQASALAFRPHVRQRRRDLGAQSDTLIA